MFSRFKCGLFLFLIMVGFSSSFMAHAEAKYPIAEIESLIIYASADATIISDFPYTNFGNGSLGAFEAGPSSPGIEIALIRFPLDQLPAPPLLSAVVNLTVRGFLWYPETSVRIYNLKSVGEWWTESTATWDLIDGAIQVEEFNPFDDLSGDVDSVTADNQTVKLGILSAVHESLTPVRYGYLNIAIRAVGYGEGARFCSREWSAVEQRPRLVVRWFKTTTESDSPQPTPGEPITIDCVLEDEESWSKSINLASTDLLDLSFSIDRSSVNLELLLDGEKAKEIEDIKSSYHAKISAHRDAKVAIKINNPGIFGGGDEIQVTGQILVVRQATAAADFVLSASKPTPGFSDVPFILFTLILLALFSLVRNKYRTDR
jgi:hypothetical protein